MTGNPQDQNKTNPANKNPQGQEGKTMPQKDRDLGQQQQQRDSNRSQGQERRRDDEALDVGEGNNEERDKKAQRDQDQSSHRFDQPQRDGRTNIRE